MLFLLTGDIQTGKTRWLERVVGALERRGTPVAGVIAPGVWREHGAGFEKLGIDNVLLPDGPRIRFARRPDLARQDRQSSQSRRAGLGWTIDDAAIAQVNAHLDQLADKAIRPLDGKEGLLVVDEIGRLELECGQGLVAALSLLEQGATPAFPHALAVVRPSLLERAHSKFEPAPWNGMSVIGPDDDGLKRIMAL